MSDTPPFDPPYKMRITIDGAERWFELRADGTQVESSAPEIQFTSAAPKPAVANRPNAGKTFLKVPYAEKDAAKSLGARWDAGKRKWYVPAGIDSALFSKWILE
jgi:hypothetical protein